MIRNLTSDLVTDYVQESRQPLGYVNYCSIKSTVIPMYSPANLLNLRRFVNLSGKIGLMGMWNNTDDHGGSANWGESE